MATVTKIDKDIAAAKAKITELQKKIRELETKRVEAENLQIVKLVRVILPKKKLEQADDLDDFDFEDEDTETVINEDDETDE